MDNFPESFDRKKCSDELAKNQLALLKETRKIFYDKTLLSVSNCDTYIMLEFPEKLWNEHKITVTKELLEKFGKLKIQVSTTTHGILKTIILGDTIPNDIKSITIEFYIV